MEVREISIGELIPYEKNPRINSGGVDAVAESIKAYGFKVPVVIDRNNVIVCGHTRYAAAKKIGMEKIPCIVADDLTDEQVKAFRIADNKVADFSIWDNKLLLEELTLVGDDFFTGFDMGSVFDDILDETDNTALETNVDGTVWRVVFESENREKIEKIKGLWDGLETQSVSS